MAREGPAGRLVVDVAAYVVARLLLVVALAAAIFLGAHLIWVTEFPLVVALLFAIVLALPLGIWLFVHCASGPRQASLRSTDAAAGTASSHSRLRGETPPNSDRGCVGRQPMTQPASVSAAATATARTDIVKPV